MLKGLSNNRAALLKERGLLLVLAFLITGCTYNGMTKVDKEYQDAGYILHCTEVAGDNCLTKQWFNSTKNTYQRYHNGPSINGTNSSNN